MFKDILHLSDVGLQALTNASAGGVLVDATSFKFGNSNQYPNKTDATDILGASLLTGTIHHVDVHSSNTAVFVLELQGHTIAEETVVHEVGVFLSSGVLLGRAVFETPYTLAANESVRFNVYLVTSRTDLTTINVTVGDYSGVPTTPNFEQLANPSESSTNVVSVLNGRVNDDGSITPVLCTRYGGGPYQWAFTDHTRVFQGEPSNMDATTVSFDSLDLEEGVNAIVHVVDGAGAGSTRRGVVVSSGDVELSSPVLIDGNTTVALWVLNAGISVVKRGYPDVDGIPNSWILTRGVNDEPVWAPPKTNMSMLNTLFDAPSTLEITSIVESGTGTTGRFPMGNVQIDNPNYVQPTVGHVCQHKSAFDVTSNELEFVEFIDPDLTVELRMFSRVASNGSRLNVDVQHVVGEGEVLEVELNQAVKDVNYIKVYVSGVRQLVSSYTYDAESNVLKTISPITSGRPVEIRTFKNITADGYSTKIYSHVETPLEPTAFIQLPVSPQSAHFVEVVQSGVHIHADNYSLSDNILLFNGQFRKGVELEVTIYDSREALGSERTNLKGVVTDAVMSSKSLRLIRHSAPDLRLPFPDIDVRGGEGIKVTGSYPNFVINSTIESTIADSTANFVINEERSSEDTSELIFMRDIKISRDMLLEVRADFSATLGPGFVTPDGNEVVDFVVGYRTPNSKEPDYGRRIQGSGTAGFAFLGNEDSGGSAHANASSSRNYTILAKNHSSKILSIVCKMRIKNANVGKYPSYLHVNVCISARASI